MDNRRLFIAFLLSLTVLLAWYSLFPPQPAEPPAAEAPARTAAAPAPGEAGSPAPPTPPPASGAAAQGEPPVQAAQTPQIAAAAEERVTLEAEGRRAVFTNRGGQLVSLTIPEQKGRPLELVRQRSGGVHPYGLVGADLAPLPLNQALFAAEKSADGRSVTFRYNGPAGAAEKSFAFNAQGFLESRVRVTGGGGGGRWGLVFGPGIRNPTEAEYENRFERRDAVYKAGDEVEIVSPLKALEKQEIPGGGLRWVGLEDSYFLSAAVPKEGELARAVLQPVLSMPAAGGTQSFIPVPPKDELTAEQKDMRREYMVVLQPTADALSLTSYWGSKRYQTLKSLPYDLEQTVNMGFFKVLVLPLLASLHWIHDHVVANYGWAIILMTIVIKLLLLPLTHKSTVSMRKMQELNPKIQAVRDRYRTKLRDKQGRPNIEMQKKMNDEVMAMYREEGVNPAGGCLPLLLQMPILYAFYALLSTAVELRGAPWILWITDLAVKDPYYVLPIVMGITQFVQVRLAPQAGDPMQRRIFQLMPVFMTFLFLGFPSGLVLYWLTNNVLTIVQQAIYNHLQKKKG